VIIEGKNGSGKTSLLEAIHYLCYIRSFRTHIPHDLVHFGNSTFFIAATLGDDTISIGSTGAKRQVKINQKAITSYKELRAVCRVVTVTQDDNEIISGSPEKRRHFLDHALLLYNDTLTDTMKTFRHVLELRNALLAKGGGSNDEFDIWTHKLWELSRTIQQARIQYLTTLTNHAHTLESYFLEKQIISMIYQAKNLPVVQTYEEFRASSKRLFEKEHHFRRSLFGAHLDDIEILFNQKPARLFSSRGQQKLLALFLKISQVSSLTKAYGPTLFLLDDFLSDFDTATIYRILKTCLTVQSQLIFTSPLSSSPLAEALNELFPGYKKISI
jgi:DNA replication and repair protein RecF